MIENEPTVLHSQSERHSWDVRKKIYSVGVVQVDPNVPYRSQIVGGIIREASQGLSAAIKEEEYAKVVAYEYHSPSYPDEYINPTGITVLYADSDGELRPQRIVYESYVGQPKVPMTNDNFTPACLIIMDRHGENWEVTRSRGKFGGFTFEDGVITLKDDAIDAAFRLRLNQKITIPEDLNLKVLNYPLTQIEYVTQKD